MNQAKFLFATHHFIINCRMSVFVQQLNHITGKMEWNLQLHDYDYKREVARSAYADMLHDKERNEKYYRAIKCAIEHLKRNGQKVHVLDIGTGTGLLSMMAASCGVDSITACETFGPMADCAEKILKKNNFEFVKLVKKRSTELVIGVDLAQRANLLVTEVFDTELIGEGAISTYSHAKKFLLTEDALCVPSKALVYAQVVSSQLINRWNNIDDNVYKDVTGNKVLTIPDCFNSCFGSSAVHDLQLSELTSNHIKFISDPIQVFEFDWCPGAELQEERTSLHCFQCTNEGTCDAVLMWWSLQMDQSENNWLSCAPLWAHPIGQVISNVSSDSIPWRDHWMQAIYYLPNRIAVQKEEMLMLAASHKEYNLWFNVECKDCTTNISLKEPMCDCMLHLCNPRNRIAQLSDHKRVDIFTRLLQRCVNANTVCLTLGTGCLLGIIAANMGAKHVYIHEENRMQLKILDAFIDSNQVRDRVTLLKGPLKDVTLENLVQTITLVLSEPYTGTGMQPWHSGLHLWYSRCVANHLLSPEGVQVLPSMMHIRAVPVAFRDLHKIRAPVGVCCGFDLKLFDQLVLSASAEADDPIEPHPLWEYPALALYLPITLLSLSLGEDLPEEIVKSNTNIPVKAIKQNGVEMIPNGVGIWVDYEFGEELISTGPIGEVEIGKRINWDMYTRQAVYLKRGSEESRGGIITSHSAFNAKNGALSITFSQNNKDW